MTMHSKASTSSSSTSKTAEIIRLARAAGVPEGVLKMHAAGRIQLVVATRCPPNRRVPRDVLTWFVGIAAAVTGRAAPAAPATPLVCEVDGWWTDLQMMFERVNMTPRRYRSALAKMHATEGYCRNCESSARSIDMVSELLRLSRVFFDVQVVHALVCTAMECDARYQVAL